MKRVRDLFRIVPGHDYELCNLKEVPNGIPFISRTAEDNGISAYVERTEDEPTPAGCLTVALGGSVLSTFLQPVACYESFHVATLHPIQPMTTNEKLWYAAAIRAHRFRYNYGRQANKELPNLLLPEPPTWATKAVLPVFSAASKSTKSPIPLPSIGDWKEFRIRELGTLMRGKPLNADELTEGPIPYVSASAFNCGISQRTSAIEGHQLHPAGCITIPFDGSVGHAYLQNEPFYAAEKCYVLYPDTASPWAKLFLCRVFQGESFRYGYGRKWNTPRMQQSRFRLPTTPDGKPDYAVMERFIQGCRFSAMISGTN